MSRTNGTEGSDGVGGSIRGLAIVATAMMYIVMLMGALVTTTGSGQGCGANWPLCKGTFMPEWDYEAIIEFSHRAVTGVAGIAVTAVALWAWYRLRHRPHITWLAGLAVGVLLLQSGLGAAAVLWPQPKWLLAAHFGISLICFAAVLLLGMRIYQAGTGAEPAPVEPVLKRWVWTVTLFAYGVIYLGALVRHLHASLACLGWPLCNGELLPPLYGPVGANVLHRIAAALLVIMVIRLALMVRRMAPGRTDLRVASTLALYLILAQVVSGAIMALGTFNLLTQMLHSAIVTAFWGALTYLSLQVYPIPAGRPDPGGYSRPATTP